MEAVLPGMHNSHLSFGHDAHFDLVQAAQVVVVLE